MKNHLPIGDHLFPSVKILRLARESELPVNLELCNLA